MNSSLLAQTAEKAVLKLFASNDTTLKLLMSILVAPFGGNTRVIF